MEINISKSWKVACKYWPPKKAGGLKPWLFHYRKYHRNYAGFQIMVLGVGVGLCSPR